MSWRRMCPAANDATVVTAVHLIDRSLIASASSSKHVTQIIEPAANPSPTDCQKIKCDANMNTGTAISGCGIDVKIDHSTVENLLTPRGINTKATARPSGMLCIASDAEMKAPRWAPSLPVKDTPMPRPSDSECSVITATIRKTLRRSFPVRSPNLSSSCDSTHFFVAITNPMPMMKPAATRIWCDTSIPSITDPSASRSRPSWMRCRLAESIIPAATALDSPSHTSVTFPRKMSGSAPRPVDSAATQP
mmetsp:Transcript_55382/g.131533  ORF Transcript_55382/g.131533 Transcript_55382/m.131533 type:complete len:249 (-) Transcript_55382:220-966(-)